MRPPPILLLQLLNVLISVALYLAIKLGTTTWTAAGWKPGAIGLAMTLGCLSYGATVSYAGHLADRHPRALVSMAGAAICLSGALLSLLLPGPATCVLAVILSFLGAAVFFPGIAGLFSDAASAQVSELSLHRRIGQYNLGWSTGTMLGMLAAGILCSRSLHLGDGATVLRIGAGLAILALGTAILLLAPYRGLPHQPPMASGDRADHPALSALTLMGRLGLLMACLVGLSLISQLDSVLVEHSHAATDAGAKAAASELAAQALTCYSGGYVLMFVLLSRWGGWVLRPWRLWLLQCGLLLGMGGLLACGLAGVQPPLAISGCAMVIGLGYGAAYTGSIYYSLRLPHGAARAAGLHETFLAVGNTIAPVASGLLVQLLSAHGMAMLAAVALVAGGYALISLVGQLLAIPLILRRFPTASAPAGVTAAAGR